MPTQALLWDPSYAHTLITHSLTFIIYICYLTQDDVYIVMPYRYCALYVCVCVLQLKDLRSQITKEACVSISYVCVLLGAEAATFAAAMLSQLIALLPNSAKVMSTSAEVCLQFIVKVGKGMVAALSVQRSQITIYSEFVFT